jgi:hypothetical protein
MKILISESQYRFLLEYDNSFEISKIIPSDINECLAVSVEVFKDQMTPISLVSYLNHEVDWSKSYKATVNGKIVGCYLLAENSVLKYKACLTEDLTPYKKLRGVEGIALSVLPEYRSLGIGKSLREIPKNLGYDYIWGQQLKTLKNLDNWLKFGRRLVGNCGSIYITLMDLNHKNLSFGSSHLFQEKGHTCGPTCVEMVSKFLNVDYGDVDDISELCGCNTTTGTIDVGMKNALSKLGISNKQNIHTSNTKEAMSYLNDIFKTGNKVFIMRTLTRGIKHWIIVYGKKGNTFLVADPWLGKITYSTKEIVDIWKPRNFDGFEVDV